TERVPRSSRSSRTSKAPAKTPEKKGRKRKSTPSTSDTPFSKLPRFESIAVSLSTKTIYVKNDPKYTALERSKLIMIPQKEGAYEVGDLIWAKMVGYPWWPCMIAVD